MKRKNYKFDIMIIGALISIILMFFNEHSIKEWDLVAYNVVLTISVSLSVTSITNFISYFFKENRIYEVAAENFSVLRDCQNYGMIGICDHIPLDDAEFRKEFLKSKELYIVMNDGKAFISDNLKLLTDRVQRKKCSTFFIIQDYKDEMLMRALEHKNEHKENYYTNKIKDLIEYHFRDLMKKRIHRIVLFYA